MCLVGYRKVAFVGPSQRRAGYGIGYDFNRRQIHVALDRLWSSWLL